MMGFVEVIVLFRQRRRTRETVCCHADRKVCIVGGGAAGIFAAIECAVVSEDRPFITVFEGSKKPLEKVRISGGGRCNTTHAAFERDALARGYPRGRRELLGPFTMFDASDTVRWFEDHGVQLKTEQDGRMFPVTDDSSTIVDSLLTAARDAGVVVRTSSKVTTIERCREGGRKTFSLRFTSGGGQHVEHCDQVLIAAGSSKLAYQWAGDLGHRLVEPVPSLFTFNIKDQALRELAGVSVPDASVKLTSIVSRRFMRNTVLEHRGPILFTHWGLSGPAILRLSAFGARLLQEQKYQAQIEINWYPEGKRAATITRMQGLRNIRAKRGVASSPPLPIIPGRLWKFLVHRTGSVDPQKPWGELRNSDIDCLATQIHAGLFSVSGKGVFKEEFVTCGGVSLKDIDMRTMQSKVVDGLYFAGEVCDYDGVTGGFNLQGAWTTGYIAGRALAGIST